MERGSMERGTQPPTWRDLDEQTIKGLFTSATGCWTVSDRVRTENGQILLDEQTQEQPTDPRERVAYALTTLTVARYRVEAWTVLLEGEETPRRSLVRAVDRARIEDRIAQLNYDDTCVEVTV